MVAAAQAPCLEYPENTHKALVGLTDLVNASQKLQR
jgi:hypothetical protein